MITIDIRGSKKKIDEVLDEYALRLSEEIINSVCSAIDKDISRVTCLVIITDLEVYSFTASRSYFETTLRANIAPLANAEMYEICAKAKQYADRISIKLLTV